MSFKNQYSEKQNTIRIEPKYYLTYLPYNLIAIQATIQYKKYNKIKNLKRFLNSFLAVGVFFNLDPSILLMDEPTAGLDFINRFNLLALLWNVSQLRKVTLVMVTHDLDIPRELGTKISVLTNGQISLPLPIDQLSNLGGEFMEELKEEISQAEKKGDTI